MNSGKTMDNLTVSEEMGLRLQWSWPEFTKLESFALGVGVEFNRNAEGKRYPYVVFYLGLWHTQIGWLWG